MLPRRTEPLSLYDPPKEASATPVPVAPETSDGRAAVQEDRSKRFGRLAIVQMAGLVLVLAALKLAAGVLVPLATAFFLAVLSYPIMRWLMNKRVPMAVALLVTMATIVMTVGGLIWLGVGMAQNLQDELPNYLRRLQSWLTNSAVWLEAQGVEGASEAVAGFDLQSLIDLASQRDVLNRVASVAGSTVDTATTFLASSVMTLVVMLFILMEAPTFRRRVAVIHRAGGPDLNALINSAQDIQLYLRVKTLMSVLTGLLAGSLCWMLGLKYPLLWGLLAFVFNFIPAVGSTAAGIPAVIEALVLQGGGVAIVVAVGYALINFICDSLIQPVLLGRQFGMSGLVVILSVIFWGWLWGPIGMFLAVPLTTLLKVMLESSSELRWISAAMAGKASG